MTYRKATKEDVPQIEVLCGEEGLAVPYDSELVFVAEHEGKIVSIISVEKEYFVTLLISKNPVAGARLWHMAEGVVVQSNIKKVKALVEEKNERHQGHLIKEGFACTETGKLVFTKEY